MAVKAFVLVQDAGASVISSGREYRIQNIENKTV